MKLKAVRIQRFKVIDDAPFDLGPMNVLVGANNSGKSSIIQGLHFGVAVLQSIELTGSWTKGKAISTSINPTQIIYSPSENLNALALGGRLLEKEGSAMKFTFSLTSGEETSVSVRKGRNRNVLVAVDNAVAARPLASLENPFTVFSPGLAGVSKTEQYISDGVLLRTIARGDANLVLRNILLRLWGSDAWNDLLVDLRDIFPGIDFRVEFSAETDEFITVLAKVKNEWIPLELVGTGVLQATQILSYIHRFAPSLVVLDEPDSHLHPNNQRLLCSLLRRVSEDRGTQVLLTTHSRHVVDTIGGAARFLWVRSGGVDVAGPDDEIGVLLDIGALDVKERATQAGTKVVMLTEDQNTRLLETLLSASGFDMTTTVVLPYYGVTGEKQLRPLVRMIQASNPSAKLLLHRDRDYLSDDEVQAWEEMARRFNVEPVVTTGTDLESHFTSPAHLAAANPGLKEAEWETRLEGVCQSLRDESVQAYVNGRIDIARSSGTYSQLNPGQLAVAAAKAVDGDVVRFARGKSVLKVLRAEFQKEHGRNLKDVVPSVALSHEPLRTVSVKVFGSESKGPAKTVA